MVEDCAGVYGGHLFGGSIYLSHKDREVDGELHQGAQRQDHPSGRLCPSGNCYHVAARAGATGAISFGRSFCRTQFEADCLCRQFDNAGGWPRRRGQATTTTAATATATARL
jgi:hypothetical protein